MHLDKLNFDSHTRSVCQLTSYATYVFLCSLRTALREKQTLLDLTQGANRLKTNGTTVADSLVHFCATDIGVCSSTGILTSTQS